MKKIYLLVLGNILFIIIFILSYNYFYSLKNMYITQPELREHTKYTFINPLLECNTEFKYYNPKNLDKELEGYAKNKIAEDGVSNISYYVRFLNNGATFGFQEDLEYTPASLLKVPVSIAFLKKKGISDLKKSITIEEDISGELNRNIGSDIIKQGKTYTFEDLFKAMLVSSDNNAAENILTYLGADAIYEVYSDFGLERINFQDLSSVNISVKNYASFLRLLYNASYISQEASEYILTLLSKSDFKTGIVSPIPQSIKVANKFGERKNALDGETQLHDCGIIYIPDNPYILCIMTKGNDFKKQEQVLQHISERVYETVQDI